MLPVASPDLNLEAIGADDIPDDIQEEYQQPLKQYWATEIDGAKFLSELKIRVHRFFDFLADTGLATRIERSHRMYYGLTMDGAPGQTAVKISGDEGELRVCEVNEYRNSLALLKTYITEHQPQWDTIAMGDDGEALKSAKNCDSILDAIMDDVPRGLARRMSQAVEDAIILNAGYLWHKWDQQRGPPAAADPESGALYRGGEYCFYGPSVYDVCFDPTIRDFGEKRWLDVRIQESRWDLMAEFPKIASEIENINSDYDSEYRRFEYQFGDPKHYTLGDQDSLWVHYFYHLPSPAMPNGRFVRHVGWEIVLQDVDELPDDGIPVHRLITSEMQLTPFGYTPAFSAQAPQELLNNIMSALATNQDVLGNIKIHKKGGDPINRAMLERGITVIETDGELTALNLLQSAPELIQCIGIYQQMVRSQTGVSDAARGQSKPSESGAARAFEEQRTQQGSSDFLNQFDDFLSNVGTGILKGYKKRLKTDDVRKIPGKKIQGKRDLILISKEALAGVERVTVVKGNPDMRTLAGRVRVGESMLQSGAIQLTREEFVTTMEQGDLRHLTRPEASELEDIHEENDALTQGLKTHVATPLNNHALHIKEHAAAAKSPEARNNPDIYQACLAAVTEHLQMWLTPMGAQMQMALGYNPGPMGGSMGPPAGAPVGGGGPPQGGQKPTPPPGGGDKPRLVGGVPPEAAAKAAENPALANAA